MLRAIGQGGPGTPKLDPPGVETPVLEAFSRYVSPRQVQEALERTGRQNRRIRKAPVLEGDERVVGVFSRKEGAYGEAFA